MDAEKEKLLKDYPDPISITQTKIILEQMKEKIFKIHTENNGIGTCFFVKFLFLIKIIYYQY